MELKINKSARWKLSHKQEAGARLTLLGGEVHRLNPLPGGIYVISGCAWVSWKGQDILLNQGQGMQFSPGSYDPLISALGTALTIEMLG